MLRNPRRRIARNQAAIGAIHGRIFQSESVARVAGQGFVGALAGQHHCHSFARQPGDKIKRNARGPHDGLIFVPDQVRQSTEKILLADQHFMMPRVDVIRHGAREGQFAVRLLGVADGKSLDWLAPHFCHQRRDRARIDAAAQKHAERHVAHQMAIDRAFQQFAIALDVIIFIARFVRLRCIQIPVLPDFRLCRPEPIVMVWPGSSLRIPL